MLVVAHTVALERRYCDVSQMRQYKSTHANPTLDEVDRQQLNYSEHRPPGWRGLQMVVRWH